MRGGPVLLLATVVGAIELCDCSKCVSAERGPSEVVNGIMLKCGLPTSAAVSADAEQCQVDGQDTVLQAAANGAVDSTRFCFFECKVPSEATLENLGLECEDLTIPERQTVQAASASGNAVDLASLGIGGGTAVQQATTDEAAAPAAAAEGPAPADAAPAATTPVPGLSMAEASKAHAEAARTEARATAAETKAASAVVEAQRTERKAVSAATATAGAVASLRGQVVQARLHARAAESAAKETADILKEVRGLAHAAAVRVGAEAAAKVQAEANSAKQQLASMIAVASVPPLPEIPESIGKVMGPYFAAAGRAMTTMGLYSDQAQQLTAAAGTMRQQARNIANQANEYQAAGNSADASTLMGTANDLMSKADASAASAQGLQSVAASINKGLPLYENARAAAGARAAYWAHLPGMIPPPIPAR